MCLLWKYIISSNLDAQFSRKSHLPVIGEFFFTTTDDREPKVKDDALVDGSVHYSPILSRSKWDMLQLERTHFKMKHINNISMTIFYKKVTELQIYIGSGPIKIYAFSSKADDGTSQPHQREKCHYFKHGKKTELI